jgi:hypothetical protein
MKYSQPIVSAWFRDAGLPEPEFEWRFHPTRKWRFDLAWPGHKVALEVDGGIWVAGRHSRGAGVKADWEKINTAQLLGWRVFRCEPRDLTTMETADMIRQALAVKNGQAKDVLVNAALTWWEEHRPVGWSTNKHLASPTVNATYSNHAEFLAMSVSNYILRTR